MIKNSSHVQGLNWNLIQACLRIVCHQAIVLLHIICITFKVLYVVCARCICIYIIGVFHCIVFGIACYRWLSVPDTHCSSLNHCHWRCWLTIDEPPNPMEMVNVLFIFYYYSYYYYHDDHYYYLLLFFAQPLSLAVLAYYRRSLKPNGDDFMQQKGVIVKYW